MQKAYSYSAKSSNGHLLEGVVHANSAPLAAAQLKRGGFTPLKLTLNPLQTFKGWFNPDMNAQELARLYTTVGRRLQNGKSMVEGLEAAIEYVQDARLRQGVMQMRQGIIDGQTEYQAMLGAGFPKRDCMVIRSTSEAGKTGESFIALGAELTRNETLRKAIKGTFRMPVIMSVFMLFFVWAALMFIAPATLAFLKQTGLKLNFSPILQAYFELVRLFHISSILSSVIYFGLAGLAAYYLRSKHFKKQLDRFKVVRDLSVKSDQARLWRSFSMLYDAAVPAREAAQVVGASAAREDSEKAFRRMAQLVEAGRSIEDAAMVSGFPRFISGGVASAASAGNMVEGLNDMCVNLEEDVTMLTAVLQENAKIFSVVGMGIGILIVFMFTYYPMIASVMSNV